MLNHGATTSMAMSERTALALRYGKCVFCGSSFSYNPEPLMPEALRKEGDVYTEAGLKEIAISSVCEFCFDKSFGDRGGYEDE